MFNITPTIELQALQELNLMSENATMGLNQLKHYAGQSHNAFWLGEVSPILKVQMLGTKALEVFTASQLTQLFIKQLDPSWVMLEAPAQYQITWGEDGSAVITEI